MRGRQHWGEWMGRCGWARGSEVGVRVGHRWLRCCHRRCRWRKVFFVSASLLSTTTEQASEAWIVLELGMRVEVCLNDLNELLLEFLPGLHWYYKHCDDLHKVILVFGSK